MDEFSSDHHEDTILRPISSRRTVQDGVYSRLGHALMTGEFDPGQMLTISFLAERFGTSHMPVREALRRLAAENALEVSSTGSAYVPAVTRQNLDDICDTRIILECAATERAVARVTPRLLRTLEHLANEHLEAGREEDVGLMLSKNQEFHFTIYHSSQSPVMVQLIQSLWLRFGPYLRMLTQHMEPSLKSGGLDGYTRHHFKIIQAMREGDVQASHLHMQKDIQSTQFLLRTLCAGGGEPGGAMQLGS